MGCVLALFVACSARDHARAAEGPVEMRVELKITNRFAKPSVLRIGHLIQPKELADYVAVVQCGFLLPVTLPLNVEQQYSGTYLLRGSLPEGVHQLNLDYDFRALHDK